MIDHRTGRPEQNLPGPNEVVTSSDPASQQRMQAVGEALEADQRMFGNSYCLEIRNNMGTVVERIRIDPSRVRLRTIGTALEVESVAQMWPHPADIKPPRKRSHAQIFRDSLVIIDESATITPEMWGKAGRTASMVFPAASLEAMARIDLRYSARGIWCKSFTGPLVAFCGENLIAFESYVVLPQPAKGNSSP